MGSSADHDDAPRHGGDLAFAAARYGEPSGGWLDLSTGINPEPYPAESTGNETIARLPDRAALAGLLDRARLAYRLPASVRLIATPGSEMAIRLLPLLAPPGKVAIVGPTYDSHAESWEIAGRPAVEIPSILAVRPETAVVVLVNPNNPDGRIVGSDALARLAIRLADRGGVLIVDEAFADVAPEVSLAPRLEEAPALILRSFGKFYGLAGLRLGFAAGHAGTVDRLARLLGDWPISAPAIEIGAAALSDVKWQKAACRRLAKDAKALRALLLRHGLTVAGGTDLFLLIEDEHAADLHRGLAEQGIWTRVFPHRPNWLRLGLPPDAAARRRLDQALKLRS
jgi:cobalamin biosynthetic protein CobC